MVAVLLAAVVVGARVGSAVVARHRAQSAADLAALAAAARIGGGLSAACREAVALAAAGGATLRSCERQALDIIVQVTVDVGMLGARASAVARAGPLSPGATPRSAGPPR